MPNQHFQRHPKNRFREFIQQTETCWLWTGTRGGDGYGVFWIDGQNRRAHRVSYELFVGPIPAGLYVCHRCDVRNCVNPEHLFLGTTQDNTRDRHTKGRTLMHERHPMAKLTQDQVAEIRRRYVPRYGAQTQLAKEFGVDRTTIRTVVANIHWR